MSQNGPYPGPTSHQWSDPDSDEPYTAPSDPWGDQPTPAGGVPLWGAHPTSIPPSLDSAVGFSQGFGAEVLNAAPPAWGTPQPPRRRNTPIVALVAVLGLLMVGGLGTTIWLLVRQQHQKTEVVPSTTKPTTAAAVAEPQPSADARFVKKSECVVNKGTTKEPAMSIVPCAGGTYEVLKRIDGKTGGEADAESKCSKVPGYTKWYFYDSQLDSLDFVLCLREH